MHGRRHGGTPRPRTVIVIARHEHRAQAARQVGARHGVVPVALKVLDERRAEVAHGLLAAERRHVAAEDIERLCADAERAPVTHRV